MEELLKIVEASEEYCDELHQLKEKFMQDLRAKLSGQKLPVTESSNLGQLPTVTPQQTKKRIKRLSDLNESDTAESIPEKISPSRNSARTSNSKLLATAVAMEAEIDDDAIPQTPQINPTAAPSSAKVPHTEPTEVQLMPPPPAPLAPAPSDILQTSCIETSFVRPQRAAKLKSEKNLKEPKLNNKLRRPSSCDTPRVKLEHEERPSQMHEVADDASATNRDSTKSTASVRSEDSVVAIPTKAPSVVEINSEDEQTNEKGSERNSVEDGKVRSLRIKIKREKSSLGNTEKNADSSPPSSTIESSVSTQLIVPLPKVAVKSETGSDDSTIASTTISANTTSTAGNTRRRKKKDALPKPIKVERFSDIEDNTRTRKGRKQNRGSGGSVYEDAVDHPLTTGEATNTPPTRVSPVPSHIAAAAGMNETVNNRTQPDKTGVVGSDATFCANAAQTTFQVDPAQTTFVVDNQNANVTVTLNKKSGGNGAPVGDTTYNLPTSGANNSTASSHHSMETAKDTTNPQPDSLLTEDESFEPEKPKSKLATLPKPGPASTKSKMFKMPTRTNELFNPLVQSPVKKKVEAFENAAIAAHNTEVTSTGRPKRTKENAAPSNLVTPIIGKIASAPALGRFLTPTQSSNLTGSLLKVKKVPSSASKAQAHPKAIASVKAVSGTTASRALSRENSAEDFRKGLHNLAEERKKQREQKHLIAAQQREAKERERAERAAKLVKEREEKRLKKQQEAEQKKQALEDIQRVLRQQEEAAKLKAAKAKAEQERELLQQMKQQNSRAAAGKMLPPPPKMQTKYTFEMLHEDDSTDEEEKTSYKRPPPPNWSRSHVRGAAIRMQQYWPTKIIDSFFSVQPMSPDLRSIFPNISSHHLKRNSSVLWTTPPRYSELPKH
ncbi:MAP7 domain-containing protein 1 isoform X1 [Rhagoletis pomonella]|uniref:MAP7 domain-containing protein 1 isoform X1 n=1 Tax=Rhagoletis pomonella TaxID=28610 RepID=UPI0017868FB7|nr:MAP7 domain-containing protein 1 isoform X1 [Rhagoletis pomonella]